jgi:hypothetical protein
MRRTIGIVSAVALVLLTGTIAAAQIGSGGPDPATECSEADKPSGEFGECVSQKASAFGRCVAAASERGEDNPAATCSELKPDPEGDNGGGNGDGNEDGEDGRQGPPEGTPQGPPEGTPQGPPEGTPQGPPEGTPQGPPEGTPQGPPEGTPQGPPEGVPGGPPEGTPAP